MLTVKDRLLQFVSVLPLLSLVISGCDSGGASVVVYTSVDDVFSRSILADFESSTGIRVQAVYDVEADKTTGLFRRLVAEHQSGRPRADVFWNSEVARTIQLDRAGALAAYASPSAAGIPQDCRASNETWTGFAARARIIIYNKNRVDEPPASIWNLTEPRWRGEAAIAQPLFGTTATHAGALWAKLGPEATKRFFLALVANDVKVLAGNSTVRDRIASGELMIGLTDTDDAVVALRKGLPVGIVFPDQQTGFPGQEAPLGTFLIPNTVALIAGAPNPATGKKLVDYLLSRATTEKLAQGQSAQIPLRAGLKGPQIPGLPQNLVRMQVPYVEVAAGVQAAREFLERTFVR